MLVYILVKLLAYFNGDIFITYGSRGGEEGGRPPPPFKPDKQKIIFYRTPQKIQIQNSHNKTDFYSKQHIIFKQNSIKGIIFRNGGCGR